MTANPVDLIGGLATTANVVKADISAWAKARVPQVMASVSEIRSTTLAAQLVVMLKTSGVIYFIDTTDTTTADDGVTCIVSLDGFRFKAGAYRERLTAARTYYVRTDGSDANTGLVNSSGGAFLTIGKAISVVGTLDIGGQNVTIQVADGTYNESPNLIPYFGRISQGHFSPTAVVIQGNHATPSNVVVNGGFTAVETGLYEWIIRDLKIVSGAANSIYADLGGWLVVDNVVFGATTSNHLCASYGYVEVVTNCTVVGGAFSHFLSINDGHVLYSAGLTITLTGTPAFSGAFAFQQSGGFIGVPVGTVFSGAATGPRWSFDYSLELAGVPGDIASLNAMFPGNATGAYVPLPVVQGGTGTTTSTGTGSAVLSASPVLTGTLTIGALVGSNDITITKPSGVLSELLTASASNIQVAYTGLGGVQYFLKDTNAGADLKYFQMNAAAGTFVFNSLTDAGAVKTSFLTFDSSTGIATFNSALVANNSVLGASSIKSNSPTAGVGYGTGAGGTVTQATSKSTGVTLNKVSGQITMNAASLAAGGSTTTGIVSFVLTDSAIAATDVLILNHISGGTPGAYTLNAQCAAGSATINVRNDTTGALAEAIVIQFALIKGVNS